MTEEERYAKVETDKQNAINQSNQIYNDLLTNNTQLAQQQKDYINNWQTTQNEIADKNATYQTELQNQNKLKAEKEFQNEAIASKNAYYDFINPYGAQAEIQAQNGLSNSGYSETTKSSAWNTHQNRTAQARATMNNAIQQYDNAIKEIELNRDTTKSQYALQALQQQLNAALQEFNNSSQFKQNQLSNNQALNSEYNTRYDTLWNQINTEKQQAESVRQFEKNYALQEKQLEEQKRQAQIEQANWEKEFQLSQQKLYANGSGSDNSFVLTDGVQNQSNISTKANALLTTLAGLKSTMSLIPGSSPNTLIINNVNKAYKNGEITSEEVNYILDKFGIE